MKIKMSTLAAGPMGVWPPGMVVVVDDDLAISLIGAGYATPVGAEHKRAVAGPPEVRDAHDVETDSRAERRAGKPRRS